MNRCLSPLAILLLLPAAASAQFAIRDGDRIAFYGDSITDNGPYTAFVETYISTRYPTWTVRYYNAGVGGDRVSGGWMGPVDQRLTRDLFSRKPSVITFMLGMNDAGYQALRDDLLAQYNQGYRHILDRVKSEAGQARVWLIKPSPFDDVTRPPTVAGGYNSVLLRYADAVGQIAKEYGHWTSDFNFPVADALYRAYSADPAGSQKILPDRVHPAAGGHLIMAASLLKSWNAPRLASEVGIDVPSGAVVVKGASVWNVKTDGTITWTQKDQWLPFPLDRRDATLMLAASSAPVIQELLFGQILRLTGLKTGDYKLTIDDVEVGKFSATELATGIDLALRDTPMARQAAEVHQMTLRRAAMKYALWRNVEFGLQNEPSRERDAAIASFDRLEDDLLRRRRALAVPKPHKFSVSPVG